MKPTSSQSSTKKHVMWYKVKELLDKGQSYSQISRNLGLHRSTISKYAMMSEEAFLQSGAYQRDYAHKMDCYEQFVLDELHQCNSYSSRQIEDHLKERYGASAKSICSKTIFNYVVHIRAKYNIPKTESSPRPYDHLPELPYGEYGQVDFGEYWMKRVDGHHLKVYFFVLVLSRSRYKYVYFSLQPFTTASTVYAHELAFAYMGGKPKKLLYDQDKVLLHDENLGDLILTKGFRSFVAQQHFEPVFCRKSDPESKGKVENVVKYVKSNFLMGRVFSNIDALNESALAWLERTGNGSMHYGIYKIPSDEFAIEKPLLQPYYGVPVSPQIEMKEYNVRKDNTISYHCSYYTVPSGTYKNAGTHVLVEELEGKLYIYSKETGKTLATHPLAEVRGSLVADPNHKTVRGVGITDKELEIRKYIGDVETLDLFLGGMANDKPRYYSKNLGYLIQRMQEYKVDILREAMLRCLNNKAYNAGMLIQVAETLRTQAGLSKQALPTRLEVPVVLQGISPEKTSIQSFEQYLNYGR